MDAINYALKREVEDRSDISHVSNPVKPLIDMNFK